MQVEAVRNNLQQFYINKGKFFTAITGSLSPNYFTNTALIHHSSSDSDDMSEAVLFTRAGELFTPDNLSSDCPSRVLLEGYSGTGKATFVKQLCLEWSEGSLFKSTELMFYLPLCDYRVHAIDSVEGMVEYFSSDSGAAKDISMHLQQTGGKSVIVIIDGFDEFTFAVRNNSFFMRLIKGGLLPEANVIVTSQPCFLASFYDDMDARIDLLGVDNSSKSAFVSENLSSIKNYFLSHLEKFPIANHFTAIPQNLEMMLHLCQNGAEIPKTVTSLYEAFIVSIITGHLQKSGKLSFASRKILDFPKEILDALTDIQKMAYDNLKYGKLSFQPDEIPEIVRSHNCFGLLKTTGFYMRDGTESKVLSFLHTGIQEYLAACHIADLDESQITTLLQKSFMSKYKHGEVHGMSLMFTNVWPLFCGIKCTSDSFHTTVTTAVKQITQQASSNQEVTTIFEDLLKCLCMLQCCLEVSNDQFYKDICFNGNCTSINLSLQRILPNQILALGTFLSKSQTKWEKVDLWDCYIQDDGIKTIHSCLCGVGVNLSIKELNLGKNCLKECSHLIADIVNSVDPQNLQLSDNLLGDAGVQDIVPVSLKTKSFRLLDFSKNLITEMGAVVISDAVGILTDLDIRNNNIGDKGIEAIAKGIQASSTIKWLDISNNQIGPIGAVEIGKSLSHNKSLDTLLMNDNSIGYDGAASIATALTKNDHLTGLFLEGDESIKTDAAVKLVKSLHKNLKMKKLWLPETIPRNDQVLIQKEEDAINKKRRKLSSNSEAPIFFLTVCY
ncbi:protein NLRC3-like [Dysidea avara]|uniref:protein NLRC3-like n=1 Tax=Dysidea avara TaxID=196820 RepID=UPI003333BF29